MQLLRDRDEDEDAVGHTKKPVRGKNAIIHLYSGTHTFTPSVFLVGSARVWVRRPLIPVGRSVVTSLFAFATRAQKTQASNTATVHCTVYSKMTRISDSNF